MKALLTALQNADCICKETNTHFEKAADMDRQIEFSAAKLMKARRKWILIGVGFAYIGSAVLLSIPFLKAIAGILGIVGGVLLGVGGFRKEKAALEEQISSLRSHAQKERNAAQRIFDENREALSFLPDDYRYPLATSYLVKTIASGRVETLGDALDRYDAQLHRWKVEEANANMLEQQQMQTAHLKSIRISSKINAAANVVNAAANIARHF